MTENVLFTEDFVKKLEIIIETNPDMGVQIIDQLDNFDLNYQNPNIHQLEENGYVLRVGHYRLFFNYNDNQAVFLGIISLDEMVLTVKDAKKKAQKSLPDDKLILI